MLTSNFMVHFSQLEDPRITNHNTRHSFFDIFVLAFVANLCGCDNWSEVEAFCNSKIDFFKQFLSLSNGIPSHDTFGRVFSLIDSVHLEELLIAWMGTIFNETKGEVIAIDGKTLRGSKKQHQHSGIHMVNAWACNNKLTLGTLRVEDKTNEITAINKILDYLNIKRCTITTDAIGCQKSIAKKIAVKGGKYVLCVKNNQKNLKTSIKMSFGLLDKGFYEHHTDSGRKEEHAHGRKESRRYITLPVDYFKELKEEWSDIQSVVKVIRTRTLKGETSEEINYYISSHSYLSEHLIVAIRKHWHVENCLHWQLDVSFDEDHCRSRVKNEANNIAILRRLSMAFLKQDTTKKGGIKTKRKTAGWDDEFLLKVLTKGVQNNVRTKACK